MFIRGNPNRLGEVVPRRFLTVLSTTDQPVPFQTGSGRLELAQAITTDGAALAARVLVNRIWLAHFGRGLLSVESWRDAMLAVSGDLDRTLGGPSVSLTDTANQRRTLYGTIHRREMSTMLLTHDFPDPTAHSPQRITTTTTLQGLYALNGPLVLTRSAALARRLLAAQLTSDQQRIALAYELLFARRPTDRETQLGIEFLGETGSADRANVWSQYAHVLLASNEFLFVN